MLKSTVARLMAASLVTLSAVCAAASDAGGGVGNTGGGAGVVKNGQYMTFYSAGLYVEPVDQEVGIPGQLPAINDLFNYISGLDFISQETKNKYLGVIVPTMQRQYQIASPSQLTPVIYARLLAEFKRVTGVDPSQMRLYAITDIPQKITYILPGFEKLDHDDQVSILFHEAFWLANPDSTYNQIVGAEMAFEAALKNPQDAAARFDFLSRMGASSSEIGTALVNWDLAQGNLKGFLDKNNQFTPAQLYGPQYMACLLQRAAINDQEYSSPRACHVYLIKNIGDLIRQFPKSMILRNMARALPRTDDNSEALITTFNSWGSSSVLQEVVRGAANASDIQTLMSCKVQLLPSQKPSRCEDKYFRGQLHLNTNLQTQQ